MAASAPPLVPELSAAQLEEILAQLQACAPAPLFAQIQSLLRVLFWVLQVLAEKKTALARLPEVLFRSQNEKASRVLASTASPAPEPASKGKTKRKGHGRLKAGDYPGARRVRVPHADLQAGGICPACTQGKLYPIQQPAQLISLLAQPIFQATLWELERLRCARCGAFLTASPPPAATVKYDPSVGTMLALLRYGAGWPMYRIAKWQNCFGVPLPASTQWELIDQVAELPELIYEQLIDLGAQGTLIHNDDTNMRVQDLRKEIVSGQSEDQDQRTGIFTTSLICHYGSHQIALFFTGRDHGGENLDHLLKRRAAGLDKPLQMCDALARNHSKLSVTELCYCLVHGRRHFVELIGDFPEECRTVIESIAQVYHIEHQIQEQNLSAAQRLQVHQERSQPVLEGLHQWMQQQLDQKKVEPNSGLGKAIQYMLRHWEPLTRFLKVAGAPIDNNICERALKMAILHRKNSLSYKTQRGAKVGDVFMSLVHTCQLHKINPFDYLTSLQKHAQRVRAEPLQWLPWNYHKTIARENTG
jgi:transposase